MRLIGAYFDLTDRISSGTASAGGNRATGQPGGRVLISVAKRLVPSAVRRNTVKRIVREAWRAALRDQPIRPSMQQAVQQEGQECLIRLKRYPGTRTEAGRVRRSDGATPPHSLPQPQGLATIKRSLRADADQLFATYLHRRPMRRPEAEASR